MNKGNPQIEKKERDLLVMAMINIFLGLLVIVFVVYAYLMFYKPAQSGLASGEAHQTLFRAYTTAIFFLLPAVAITYIYSGVCLKTYLKHLRNSRSASPEKSC